MTRRLGSDTEAGERVTVALSGGLDSMVLLDLLHRLAPVRGLVLAAVHVDHGLQPQAADWVAFCRAQCQVRGIPLTIKSVTVDRRPSESLEDQARERRYGVYAALDCDTVALAHHRDDQAETVLLQLLRGAGLAGLAGMPLSRPLAQGAPRLWRPLLDLGRADLQRHAQQQNLTWVEDPTNQDHGLRRNYLRHRVAPLLDAGFPGWQKTLARSARQLAEADRWVQGQAREDLDHCCSPAGLDLLRALALGPERATQVVRRWVLEATGRPCASRHLDQMLAQADAAPDRHPVIRWPGWRVARHRNHWNIAAEPSGKRRPMLKSEGFSKPFPAEHFMALERTLSIIKPDAVAKNVIGEIYTRFEKAGLRIVAARMAWLSQADAEGFYAVHRERPFFKDLVNFMSSGPVMIQALEGENAIFKHRELMGATDPKRADPGTIRADFADSIDANAVHGSDGADTAAQEIAYFFPALQVYSR